MQVIYEDNHIIAVNKAGGEVVQSDKTGDQTLLDIVKQYLKEKYEKPGNVFLGLPHRLDRPTTGIVVLAKTGKILPRLNKLFQTRGEVKKTYWAVVDKRPPKHTPIRLFQHTRTIVLFYRGLWWNSLLQQHRISLIISILKNYLKRYRKRIN